MGSKRGKAKEWQSSFVKGRGHRPITFVNIGLGMASAVHVQVFTHVGVRENQAGNRGKLLLILTGHTPCEPNNS